MVGKILICVADTLKMCQVGPRRVCMCVCVGWGSHMERVDKFKGSVSGELSGELAAG